MFKCICAAASVLLVCAISLPAPGVPQTRRAVITTGSSSLAWQAGMPLQVIAIQPTHDYLAWGVCVWNPRPAPVTHVQLGACYYAAMLANQAVLVGTEVADLVELDLGANETGVVIVPTFRRSDLIAGMRALGCRDGTAIIGVVSARWADGITYTSPIPFSAEANAELNAAFQLVDQRRAQKQLTEMAFPAANELGDPRCWPRPLP